MWEIAAIVEVLERKGASAKQDLYDIITEFRRKNPLVELGCGVDADMVLSPGSERSYKEERHDTVREAVWARLQLCWSVSWRCRVAGRRRNRRSRAKTRRQWCWCAAGEFTMGGNEAVEEKPVHQVSLDAYLHEQMTK